jgi:hypothetical protein
MTSRLNKVSEVALNDDSVIQYKDTGDILGGNRCIRNIQKCADSCNSISGGGIKECEHEATRMPLLMQVT